MNSEIQSSPASNGAVALIREADELAEHFTEGRIHNPTSVNIHD